MGRSEGGAGRASGEGAAKGTRETRARRVRQRHRVVRPVQGGAVSVGREVPGVVVTTAVSHGVVYVRNCEGVVVVSVSKTSRTRSWVARGQGLTICGCRTVGWVVRWAIPVGQKREKYTDKLSVACLAVCWDW
jgi:hypothetical protein